MKAIKEAIALLKFFKDRKNTRLTTMIKAQSCIAELEALQSRNCKGCKAFNGVEDGIILCLKFHYVKTGYDFNDAHFCCNKYEAKDEQ